MPITKEWFENAKDSEVCEPNAMVLSTCGKNNRPSARVVLLKEVDKNGFVWFTNYDSKKGQELKENPYASLTFLWAELERSIRVEGVVERVTPEESDRYFFSRPRSSRLGAWSSNQSRKIASRDDLETQERNVKKRFEDTSFIPRPEHWGGYRLTPTIMEFWKGRESRLHDRIVYTLSEGDVSVHRLQP